MLHIHNGDASANILQRSDLPGEHLPWREALLAGPAPGGVDLDEWIEVRAGYIARAYETDRDECRNDLRRQEETLRRVREHDEVVLWFEHDLSCQLILIYLLNRLAGEERGDTRLSLVCIDHFPGIENFRSLGELTPEQMASLFDLRQPVSDEQIHLASEGWKAYSSPDPMVIEQFLRLDTSALPFLGEALNAHLDRFPSTSNGLGFIENKALELIDAGHTGFTTIFAEFGATEPIYGYGDFQLWNDLLPLGTSPTPLLTIGIDTLDGALRGGGFKHATFALTNAGTEVFADQRDAIELNGIDTWLGGVHLTSDNLWRWDEEHEKMMKDK